MHIFVPIPPQLTDHLSPYFFAGALQTIHGLHGSFPIMAYLLCTGSEPQLGNCTGFSLSPYIPSWYCNSHTLAGVRCSGKAETLSTVNSMCMFPPYKLL